MALGSKTVTAVSDAPNFRGGHWASNGVILFGSTDGILQVPQNGGTPQPATPTEKSYYDVSPVMLPDGKHFLFVRAQAGVAGMFTRGDLKLASLGGPSKTLLSVRGATIRYGDEHLLYLTAQGLVAQRFDMHSLDLQGEPVQLVGIDTQFPIVNFNISSNGILAYTLSNIGRGRELLQYSRSGELKSLSIPPGLLNNPRLSPDGTRITYDVNDAMSLKRDIWIFDLKRQTPTRLTFGDGNYHDPMWSPDGRRVVYTSNVTADHSADFSIVAAAADGHGSSETFYRAPSNTWARSWSRDGRFLFLETSSATFGLPTDIGAFDLLGDRKLHSVVQDRFTHRNPQISPDGKWLAFVSTEAGGEEVFVQPFPGPGLRQRVSLGGGIMPRWRSDGRELYFVTGNNKVAAASIISGPSGLEVGKVQTLFAAPPLLYPNGNPLDVSSDGKMFILCSTGAQQTLNSVNLIVNWKAGLSE